MYKDHTFRMGRLDHLHVTVPNRGEALEWYCEHLGFEPVHQYDFWANGFPGGPLQISADGGESMLALFEASDSHPMVPQQLGIAFSVDTETFVAFSHALPNSINNPKGAPLEPNHLIDFDMCWAYELADPWGNQYELNCYDYENVATNLVQADGLTPVRYWPKELYENWRNQ